MTVPLRTYVYVEPQYNLYCPVCGYVEASVNRKEPGKALVLCPLCIKTDPSPIALVEWKYLGK